MESTPGFQSALSREIVLATALPLFYFWVDQFLADLLACLGSLSYKTVHSLDRLWVK